MPTEEFYDCLRRGCWISDVLTKKSYISFWPTLVKEERSQGFAWWSFYVEWRVGQGTHVNKVRICERHHDVILAIYESESNLDVKEQEATESWLTKMDSQATRI